MVVVHSPFVMRILTKYHVIVASNCSTVEDGKPPTIGRRLKTGLAGMARNCKPSKRGMPVERSLVPVGAKRRQRPTCGHGLATDSEAASKRRVAARRVAKRGPRLPPRNTSLMEGITIRSKFGKHCRPVHNTLSRRAANQQHK